MSLAERTRDYEFLVRFNEDGSVGSHFSTITEVLRDGVVISAAINYPVPLSSAAGLSQKVGDVIAGVLVINEDLTNRIEELEAEIAALQAQLP